jgi:hypothetical protein
MRRAIPLAALAAIAVLLFARPIVRNEVLTLRDHSDYFQPLRLFTCQELRRGHLPLWNPYNASGEPWLANPQTGVFYPPSWIFVIVPFATAYTLYLAFHVALLGCGAFLLLQRLCSPAGAFLGALTLMLCGPSLSLLDVSNTLTTFAWIPLVLWSALAAGPALSSVLIALCFLGGEPFFAALAALMWVVCRAASPGGRESFRPYIDVALTSFALTAVQLLPFLSWIRNSDRAGNTLPDEVLKNSFPLSGWLNVFLGGNARQEFVPVVYIGIVASVLAIIAVAAAWRRRTVQFAVALLGIAMLTAAGAYLAPVAYLLTHLPVTVMRYPARMLPLAALAIAVLCAIGWDSMARRLRYRWLPLLLAAVIVIDLTPKIAPLLESRPFVAHPTPYDVYSGRDSKFIRLLSRSWNDRGAWIAGYMNLFDRRFDSWTAAPVVSERYVRAYGGALRDPAARKAMSIGYVLSDQEGKIRLYRDLSARPLAYWRGDDGMIIGPSLLALTTTAFHVTINAPRDGIVYVAQQQASGWRVSIDGAPAERIEGELFCAVRVKRGRHAIEWRYRPSSLIVGAILTLFGFLRVALSSKFVKHGEKKIFFTMHLRTSSADVESRSSTFSVLVLRRTTHGQQHR